MNLCKTCVYWHMRKMKKTHAYIHLCTNPASPYHGNTTDPEDECREHRWNKE